MPSSSKSRQSEDTVMGAILPLIVTVIESLLPIINGATTGQVSNIIVLLEKIIPTVVQEATDLVQPIQNIIASLSSNSSVTADQIAQLKAQSDALDAALDAIAAQDNLF